MKRTDIRPTKSPLVVATAAEVDALEAELWITFPKGYREYVTGLGEGVFAESLIRIYPPWRIRNELTEWRRRINKYWFWDGPPILLPKDRALECIIIGDTVNGDELVFHPTRPEQVFALPRGGEQAMLTGKDLLSALEWICTSGELCDPIAGRDFEPFDSRKEPAAESGGKVVDPEGESLDELIETVKAWANRHSLIDLGRKAAEVYRNEERDVKRIYEGLIFDSNEFPYGPGFVAVYQTIDKESGLEVGTLVFTAGEGSQGSEYTQHTESVELIKQSRK